MQSRVLSAIALCLAVAAVSPAFGDAWGASWGYVDGVVTPGGPDDTVVWNTKPADWLLHAEAEVHHYHPYHTSDYGADSELWDPLGDGYVSLDTIQTGDLAKVEFIEAAVDLMGWPTARLESYKDVYSFAHDIPNSSSDAAGLAQHDNLFWLAYDGPGDPPDFVSVTLALQGQWYLEGDSEPDDDWWADWFAYAEVYDADAQVLGNGSVFHQLHGPGAASASGSVDTEFVLDLNYDTPYAFRFWVSGESHAEAIPEPAALELLLAGGLVALRRRNRARAADRRRP